VTSKSAPSLINSEKKGCKLAAANPGAGSQLEGRLEAWEVPVAFATPLTFSPSSSGHPTPLQLLAVGMMVKVRLTHSFLINNLCVPVFGCVIPPHSHPLHVFSGQAAVACQAASHS
jgi:hypothetical protein